MRITANQHTFMSDIQKYCSLFSPPNIEEKSGVGSETKFPPVVSQLAPPYSATFLQSTTIAGHQISRLPIIHLQCSNYVVD